MGDVRPQYFLTYAVQGAVIPYVAVYFKSAGLSDTMVGLAFSLGGLGVLFTPVLLSWAADAHADPRKLMVLTYLIAGTALVALGLSAGTWTVIALWTVYAFFAMPIMALQDGIHFSLQRRRAERGEVVVPYHRVRVWGTVGFIVPSFALFLLLRAGLPIEVVLYTGAVVAGLGALHALRLDDPRPEARKVIDPEPTRGEVPVVQALKVLLRPPLLGFCIVMALAHLAGAAYYPFYPIYLTERLGVGAEWLGLISNIGVVIEIFFVLGYGRLVSRLGLRGFMLASLAAAGLRTGLLALLPSVGIAIGTQLFHGLQVTMTQVLPQTFINDHANDRFRHSMQGTYGMLMGATRSVGSLIAGPIAAASLLAVFGYAASLCVVAMLLVLVLRQIRLHHPPQETTATASTCDCEPEAA